MSGERRARLQAGWRFVRGVSKSVKRGDLFPAAGRLQPVPAPLGTHSRGPDGGPVTRFRKECGWFTETTHRLPVRGLERPVEILHLTDVHLRDSNPWVDELCAHIRGLSPDLIAITGDVITRGWTRNAVDQFLGSLPEAPLGRWAVMGNWEYWSEAPPPLWAPILEEHGIRLLMDEWTDVGPLILAGTDDQLAGEPDPEGAIGQRPPGHPTVVLTHSPAYFPDLVADDVALVLAGHSHGGQVRLPALGAFWVPKGTDAFISGWYREADSHLFVSRGIGWSIAPVRLWCTPELARIQLVPA